MSKSQLLIDELRWVLSGFNKLPTVTFGRKSMESIFRLLNHPMGRIGLLCGFIGGIGLVLLDVARHIVLFQRWLGTLK